MIIKRCDFCGDTIPDMESINPNSKIIRERNWYMMDRKGEDMCIRCYRKLLNREKEEYEKERIK